MARVIFGAQDHRDINGRAESPEHAYYGSRKVGGQQARGASGANAISTADIAQGRTGPVNVPRDPQALTSAQDVYGSVRGPRIPGPVIGNPKRNKKPAGRVGSLQLEGDADWEGSIVAAAASEGITKLTLLIGDNEREDLQILLDCMIAKGQIADGLAVIQVNAPGTVKAPPVLPGIVMDARKPAPLAPPVQQKEAADKPAPQLVQIDTTSDGQPIYETPVLPPGGKVNRVNFDLDDQ